MTDAPFTRRAVDDPTSLGLDADAIADLIARAQTRDRRRARSLVSARVRARWPAGIWVTLGDAAPESRYVIFSSTKPVVAAAMWILMGEGAIDVSRRVAEIIPEFATNGKDVITVEQVMLHTSGFPAAPFEPLDWDDRDRAARAVRELAVQLGAGHALRVPPHVGALGARRADRAVHGRRLP